MEPETTLELGLGAESEITGHRGGQVTVAVWVEDALPYLIFVTNATNIFV